MKSFLSKKLLYEVIFIVLFLLIEVLYFYFFESFEFKDLITFNPDVFSLIFYIYFIILILSLSFFKLFKKEDDIENRKIYHTLKQLFFISFLTLPVFFINNSYINLNHMNVFLHKEHSDFDLYFISYGKIAYFYFALELSIGPLLYFIKNYNIRNTLILLRRIFIILTLVFFLKHILDYYVFDIINSFTYDANYEIFFIKHYKFLLDYSIISGLILGIFVVFLGITSSRISVRTFYGKGWRNLQTLAYPIFLISIIHIIYISEMSYFYMILVFFVVSLRTISSFYKIYLNKKEKLLRERTTRFICRSCGYVYDENIGDPDSGIAPGTKFEDIPDDWYCPVCGVGKSDFRPYD